MTVTAFPVSFPRLESNRLVLRELNRCDASSVFKNFSEDTAINFIYEPFTRLEQAEQLIEAFSQEFKIGKTIMWAITLKNTDSCIGTCGFMLKSSAKAEIGYDLAKAYWGRGLMSEALREIIAYGIEEVGIIKINAEVYSHNTRSLNLLKRLGFKLHDIGKDSHFFSLNKKSWERIDTQ